MKTPTCRLLSLLAVATLSAPASASERDYQLAWCEGRGVAEYVLPDRTRVDCLTAGHAVEVDFAKKWAESIGQALYYARMTDRRPGVLLIIEESGDCHYLPRLRTVAANNRPRIRVWLTGAAAEACEISQRSER